MEDPEKKVFIGQLHRPHGIKGHLKASLQLPGKLALADLIGQLLFVEQKQLELLEAFWNKDLAVLLFKGVGNLSEAEGLKNKAIFLKRAQVGELNENEFYTEDLLNLPVVDSGDPEQIIGHVLEVDNIPGNPLLKIKTTDQTEFLLPLVDEYVVEISSAKVVIKDWQLFR